MLLVPLEPPGDHGDQDGENHRRSSGWRSCRNHAIQYTPSLNNFNGVETAEIFNQTRSNPPGFTVGQTVWVAYAADDSKQSIVTFGQCYAFSVIATAIGIADYFFVGMAFLAGPKIMETLYLAK